MTTKTRKRTTAQVHEDGGHTTAVASCSACQSEAEADRQAELARTAQPETVDVEPVSGGDLLPPVEAPVIARAGDGRPQCNVPGCVLPEFLDGIGVCGGHYATRRGYANRLRS